MGFVEWYTIGLLTVVIFGSIALDGKPKSHPNHDASDGASSFLLFLPLIGRVFGWF